ERCCHALPSICTCGDWCGPRPVASLLRQPPSEVVITSSNAAARRHAPILVVIDFRSSTQSTRATRTGAGRAAETVRAGADGAANKFAWLILPQLARLLFHRVFIRAGAE